MKKHIVNFLIIGALSLSISSCVDDGVTKPETKPSTNSSIKTYDLQNLSAAQQIASARVFYQEDASKSSAKKPLLLIVHGYQGKKEDHFHQAKNAAKQGIIAIVFTTKFATRENIPPSTWSPAYKEMVELALRDASSDATPIKGKADTNNISLMGHSMGGGGLFHFADDHKNTASKIKTYIALAPYKFSCSGTCSSTAETNESNKPYPGTELNKPLLILYGSADNAITKAMPNGYYNKVKNGITKVLIGLKDVQHNDYGNLEADRSFMHQVIDKYIADWLKIQVLGVDKNQTLYRNIRVGGEITELKTANF